MLNMTESIHTSRGLIISNAQYKLAARSLYTATRCGLFDNRTRNYFGHRATQLQRMTEVPIAITALRSTRTDPLVDVHPDEASYVSPKASAYLDPACSIGIVFGAAHLARMLRHEENQGYARGLANNPYAELSYRHIVADLRSVTDFAEKSVRAYAASAFSEFAVTVSTAIE